MGPEKRYLEYLRQGEFRLQRNTETGKWTFYPRAELCGENEAALEWCRPSGRGTVYATTDNVTRTGNRNISIVELDEGVRMLSRVESAGPVAIGDRVIAHITCEEDEPLVIFVGGHEEDRT